MVKAEFPGKNESYKIDTMMKKILTIIALFVAISATAQKTRFEVNIISDDASVERVSVHPMDFNVEIKSVPMRAKDGKYTGSTPASAIGFYSLAIVRNQSQLLIPVYIGDANKATLNVKIDGRSILIEDTPDNHALTSLNNSLNALDRRLWLENGLNGEQMKELILAYGEALDSLNDVDKVSPPVYEYMKVMAYVRAFNAYNSIPRAQQIPSTSIPFSRQDILPMPVEVLDNEYASLFYATAQIVLDELPSLPSLLDRLANLYAGYSNNALRMCVATAIMKDYIFNYNYSSDFDSGLALVKKATDKYGFTSVFVDEFMKRKSTVVGSPFPEGVTLVDAEGNSADMSQFKGKFVYVDLWASWCGPCCKEVPHLKKLEKELKNKDVVFVSVSSDTDEQAWKNKMKELDMHGHQYLDKGNTLCEALNVKGIPFFVIYDKAGNLYTYGAMRPSTGARLKDFLESLH